jgi:hypothetical protein
MQALHDVVKAGYARYIGMSNCAAYQFHAMQNYAINNKLTPFISVQNQYNLICREEEREMIPTLKVIFRTDLYFCLCSVVLNIDVWSWVDSILSSSTGAIESSIFATLTQGCA